MHGAHQDPHTLTTTTWPRSSREVVRLPVQGGAAEADRVLAVADRHLGHRPVAGDEALLRHRRPRTRRSTRSAPPAQPRPGSRPYGGRVAREGSSSGPGDELLAGARAGTGSRSRAGSSYETDDQVVAGEGERRQRGQRALALARVVPEPPAARRRAARSRSAAGGSRSSASWPRAASRAAAIAASIRCGDLAVRLAPGRPERVAQVHASAAGRVSDAVADAEALALEDVAGLDQPVVGRDRQAERLGAMGAAVSCARSSGERHDVRDVGAARPAPRSARPSARPRSDRWKSGQPAVEHPARVVHLAVAQQVHDRASRSSGGLLGCAAARAACGRASAIRSSAASSWAAETNQASKADGGR